MAKDKPIEPVSVTAVSFENADHGIAIPPGNAYVVPMLNGKEVDEQAFFVSIATADKYYGNKALFAIKKKN